MATKSTHAHPHSFCSRRPPSHPHTQLIGRATIYLDSLLHLLGIHEDTPVYDYKGKEEGQLKVRCVPHLSEEAPTTEEEEEAQDFGTFKLSELRGHKLGITIFIDKAQGLPATRCTGVFVRYKFFYEDKVRGCCLCNLHTELTTIDRAVTRDQGLPLPHHQPHD